MPHVPERLTGVEINDMATAVVTRQGMIFTDPNLARDSLGLLFALMDWTQIDAERLGGFYVAMNDALPNFGVNDLPIFLAARMFHREDGPALAEAIERKLQALQQ